MKPILYALFGTICYAMGNVLLEQKLSKYNNLTLIVCFSFITCGLALIMRQFTKNDDPSYSFPVGLGLVFMLVLGVIYFGGDYFFIGAYTNGGNLFTIVSITLLFPVFASIFKLAFTKNTPNLWHIGGYLLATLAVLMVTRGNMVK